MPPRSQKATPEKEVVNLVSDDEDEANNTRQCPTRRRHITRIIKLALLTKQNYKCANKFGIEVNSSLRTGITNYVCPLWRIPGVSTQIPTQMAHILLPHIMPTELPELLTKLYSILTEPNVTIQHLHASQQILKHLNTLMTPKQKEHLVQHIVEQLKGLFTINTHVLGTLDRVGNEEIDYLFDVDHIDDLYCGGEDNESNLQLLCPACHRYKTRMTQSIKKNDPQAKISLVRRFMGAQEMDTQIVSAGTGARTSKKHRAPSKKS